MCCQRTISRFVWYKNTTFGPYNGTGAPPPPLIMNCHVTAEVWRQTFSRAVNWEISFYENDACSLATLCKTTLVDQGEVVLSDVRRWIELGMCQTRAPSFPVLWCVYQSMCSGSPKVPKALGEGPSRDWAGPAHPGVWSNWLKLGECSPGDSTKWSLFSKQ